MLKQSVRAVVLFFSLITAVASVNAQSTQRFQVHVPFQFILNGQTLTAGTYTIERTDAAKPNIITLKRVDGRIVRLVLTQRVERDNPSTASSLIFIRREGKHYLFQVWNVGAMNGSQIPSAYERERSDRQRKDLTIQSAGAEVEQNPYQVNYEQILESVASYELDSIIRTLSEQLPHDWVDAYRLANRTHANVLRIKHDGFEYLFDHSSEL